MPPSAQELLDTAQHLQLLTPPQLEDLAHAAHRLRDAKSLTDHFLQLGWMTPYQVKTLLAGQGSTLRLGSYQLLEPLGEGGMGQVFKARHVRLNRIVALKTIHPKLRLEHPDVIRRFEREAQAVAQLLHPNVVILFDADEIDGVHFIAMEYVDGVDLAKMVKMQGALPVPMACDFVRQTAMGLQHAFEQDLVHRDIKPSNLLVTKGASPAKLSGVMRKPTLGGVAAKPARKVARGGVIKILDMGLVRLSDALPQEEAMTALTHTGAVVGTPDFIAPEQARNASRVDIRADIYSLGCTFYFLLTGRLPFPDGTAVEKLMKHQNEEPMPAERIRPNIPPEVIAILRTMMAKDVGARFQTPAEVVDAINQLIVSRRVATAGGKSSPDTPLPARIDEGAMTLNGSPLQPPTMSIQPDLVAVPARRLATVAGHRGSVLALAFSADGKVLASGGVDGTAKLWDVNGLTLKKSLTDRMGEVAALAFAPTGRYVVTGSSGGEGRMWLWDWEQSGDRERVPFPGESYLIRALAMSPDGKTLAGASGGMVLVWNLAGGRDLRKPTLLKGHTATVNALAFSPDSGVVASGGDDTTVRAWEPGRFWGKEKVLYTGHSDVVRALAYSPDGSVLASAGKDRAVSLWDASGAVSERVATLEGHNGTVCKLHFTPTGELLLSVTEAGQVIVWETAAMHKVREWQLEHPMIASAAYSHDGQRLAVGTHDGQIALFDLDVLVMESLAAAARGDDA